MRGRPTNLTPALQKRFVKALKETLHVDMACLSTGLPRGTFYTWMRRGKEEGDYSQFRRAVKRALAEVMQHCVKNIVQAGEKNWQAHAWILERRWPDRFASWQKEVSLLRKELAELKAVQQPKLVANGYHQITQTPSQRSENSGNGHADPGSN